MAWVIPKVNLIAFTYLNKCSLLAARHYEKNLNFQFSWQSFKKYMTFKKDYNELLLHLLRGLVKDALYFEELMSGTTARLTHIKVKVEELRMKVLKGDWVAFRIQPLVILW